MKSWRGWSADSEVDPEVMVVVNAPGSDHMLSTILYLLTAVRRYVGLVREFLGKREDKRTRGQGSISGSNKAVIGTECR